MNEVIINYMLSIEWLRRGAPHTVHLLQSGMSPKLTEILKGTNSDETGLRWIGAERWLKHIDCSVLDFMLFPLHVEAEKLSILMCTEFVQQLVDGHRVFSHGCNAFVVDPFQPLAKRAGAVYKKTRVLDWLQYALSSGKTLG